MENDQPNIMEELSELGEECERYLKALEQNPDALPLAKSTCELGEKMQSLGMRFINTGLGMANDAAKEHRSVH